MIVTCPSCSSKYRVRDEAVAPEGAELQCPTCSAVFMAHPPKADVGVAAALEKMSRARDVAEKRVAELERALAERPVTNADELLSVKQALIDAQRKQKTTAAELDVANGLVASLQVDIGVLRARGALEAKKIPSPVDLARPGRGKKLESGLIAAVGPMLWGLEQSISYLEQFAGKDATLAGHVRQLRLLQKVLARMTDAS